MVVEDCGDGVALRQEGVVEEVVMGESRAAVDAHQRSDVGFDITKDAVVGLERLASGGIVEWSEAVI